VREHPRGREKTVVNETSPRPPATGTARRLRARGAHVVASPFEHNEGWPAAHASIAQLDVPACLYRCAAPPASWMSSAAPKIQGWVSGLHPSSPLLKRLLEPGRALTPPTMQLAIAHPLRILPPRRANASAWERGWDVIAWVLSLWFGCGLMPRAPGTAGTLGAVPLYLALRPFGWGPLALSAVVLIAIAIAASTRVARLHGTKDPQFICVDEVAGVLVTWLGAPYGWTALVTGFVLFRILDTWKPFPARLAESLPLGFGIVLDDVAAGVWGAAALFVLHRLGWL
jgi:phosphatidylglycerophosphatase A